MNDLVPRFPPAVSESLDRPIGISMIYAVQEQAAVLDSVNPDEECSRLRLGLGPCLVDLRLCHCKGATPRRNPLVIDRVTSWAWKPGPNGQQVHIEVGRVLQAMKSSCWNEHRDIGTDLVLFVLQRSILPPQLDETDPVENVVILVVLRMNVPIHCLASVKGEVVHKKIANRRRRELRVCEIHIFSHRPATKRDGPGWA